MSPWMLPARSRCDVLDHLASYFQVFTRKVYVRGGGPTWTDINASYHRSPLQEISMPLVDLCMLLGHKPFTVVPGARLLFDRREANPNARRTSPAVIPSSAVSTD